MLNSAAGVVLPWPMLPPIREICATRSFRSGCSRRNVAMLVSGPTGTRVTGSGEASRVSAIRATAPPFVGPEVGLWDFLRTVQSALAVNILGRVERPFQGFRSANAHRHVRTLDEGQHPQGVARGLLDGNVAGDGRDGEQVKVRVSAGQHQGHSVVVARVYVQDHRFRTHDRSSPHHGPTLSYLFASPAYSAAENGAEGRIKASVSQPKQSMRSRRASRGGADEASIHAPQVRAAALRRRLPDAREPRGHHYCGRTLLR